MNPLNLLFPRKCPYCGVVIGGKELECEYCRAEFPQKPYIRTLPCGNECVAAFIYDGPVRDAVKSYKFNGRRDFYRSFAAALSRAISECGYSFDVVTCVPLSKKRMKTRGYNQSEVVAKEVARLLSIKYMRTLEKVRENKEQHSLNRDERESNIVGVYKRIDGINIDGKRVLLIDDIVTSGFTLSECCRVLIKDENVKITCGTIAISY